MSDKPYSPACERNQASILAVLRQVFAHSRDVLEIGSGTGQHAVHFAAALAHLRWQCSDRAVNLNGIAQWLNQAALPNTPAPVAVDVMQDMAQTLAQQKFDAIYSANTLHIMAWPQVQRFFTQLPALMLPKAVLLVYGPFNYQGQFTSDSNARFDASLRSANPTQGLRNFEAVNALAQSAGLMLLEDIAMPANNRCLVWRRA